MKGELGRVDRKILVQLLLDSRQPLSRIAAKAMVSKQNASYRIQKMVESNGINSFIALIDWRKAGFMSYYMNFKLAPISEAKEKKLMNCILSIGVTELFKCEGEWDLLVAISAESEDGLAAISLKLHYLLRGMVLGAQWHMPLSTTTLVPPSIAQNDGDIERAFFLGGAKVAERLDEKDRMVLSAISANSRATYTELSKATGLLPETVRYRLKMLEKRKIICGYTISLGTELDGFAHYRFFINLGIPTEENIRKVVSFLLNLGQVRRIVRFLSEFELMYDIRVADPKEAREVTESVARRFHKIISTQVSLRIIAEHRFSYFPPINYSSR